MAHREAGCGLERHAANVAGLIGFGKTASAPHGSRRRGAVTRLRIARATQPCLGGFARYNRVAPCALPGFTNNHH
jgi:hypothetical protein